MCVYVMDSQTVIKTLIFNPPHQNNPTFKHTSLSTQQNYDTEISIFDAHKYFNDIKPDQTLSSVRRNSFRRIPTPSSEASWNSLLPNPPNNVSANYSSKWISSAKKWLFRTKCCCNAEKSVQVKQLNSDSKHNESVVRIETKKTSENIVQIHHIKAAPRQQRISASARSFIDGAVGFTFPILNSNSPNGIEHTSSDGFPANYKVESMHNCSDDDDDVGSEASSDLFEIESFSTQTASSNEIDDVQQGRRSVEAERECFPSGLTPLAVQAGGRPPWAKPSSHSGAMGSSTTYGAASSTTVI